MKCNAYFHILFSSQVEWAPWADIEGFHGFGRALTMSRTRCLIRDEYGTLFYLGERVIRQHTPRLWPRVPAFPPLLMRRTAEIDPGMAQVLLEGLDFQNFIQVGDYVAFADRYLQREPKGVRGRTIYARYRALGGDPLYIRGQLYISGRVPREMPPIPSTRDTIEDSDDDDPDGEREEMAAGGGGGPEGGDGGGDVPMPEQPTPVSSTAEGIRTPASTDVPVGTVPVVSAPGAYEMPSGTVPEVSGDVGASFPARSWPESDFMFDGFAGISTSSMGVPSVTAPSLRETVLIDPPGVRTFATLTPLPTLPMGIPTLTPDLGTSSMPPPRPSHVRGSSSAAAGQAGPSSVAPITPLPVVPREISYIGIGVRQYEVPAFPLPSPARDFLADVPNDAVILLSPFKIHAFIDLFLIRFLSLICSPLQCLLAICGRCTTGLYTTGTCSSILAGILLLLTLSIGGRLVSRRALLYRSLGLGRSHGGAALGGVRVIFLGALVHLRLNHFRPRRPMLLRRVMRFP